MKLREEKYYYCPKCGFTSNIERDNCPACCCEDVYKITGNIGVKK